jgi:hypothetical protein
VTRVEDRCQSTTGWKRSDEDFMDLVIDNVTSFFIIEWANDLVESVVLVSIEVDVWVLS